MTDSVRPREHDALIQSLRAGVVPRVGQHLIQVGRLKEIEALLKVSLRSLLPTELKRS